MLRKINPFLIAIFIIGIFVSYSADDPRPLLGHGLKFSVFYRNYKQFGLAKNKFLPSYNTKLTNPPSETVVSHSPFLPLVMYKAACFFGDKPSTYRGVIIVINAIFFFLLYLFVERWWGIKIALWALLFSALSRYALAYGARQTYEQLCLIGGFSAIFLYFEWLKTRRPLFFTLCALAYLIGFMGDYSTAFAALVICLHWAFFVKNHSKGDLLKLSLLPVITVSYAALMIFLIHSANIPLAVWVERINARLTSEIWQEVFYVFSTYTFRFIGLIPIMLSVVFLIFGLRRNKRYIKSPLELGIILCLLITGLVPVIAFGNAYLYHPFLIMSLVPFFTLSGALGLDILLSNIKAAWIKRILVIAIILGFAIPSFYKETRKKFTEFYENRQFIINFTQKIKPGLKPGDKLLVLSNGNKTFIMTVFHTLWIPVFDISTQEALNEALASKEYSLLLTLDPYAYGLVKRNPELKTLFSERNISFLKILN